LLFRRVHFGILRLTVFPVKHKIACDDFAARFIELGLHVAGEFKLVFKEIINPRADFSISARQAVARKFLEISFQARVKFYNAPWFTLASATTLTHWSRDANSSSAASIT
jgi:hypothetical protein